MNPTRFWTYRSPITDTEHFIDIVYNYGALILTPNFVAKFIKETYNILQ
jgi:hypothetical protein